MFDPLGAKAGERVTAVAITTFRDAITGGEGLRDALRAANRAVNAAVEADSSLRGAGCTAAAVRIEGPEATMAWAGDVDVLRLRNDALDALTQPHSFLPDLPHVIVRALGMHADLDVDIRTTSAAPGDLFLLVSNGVRAALGEGLLLTFLREHRGDNEACARALVQSATQNGAKDALDVLLVTVR